MKCYYHSADLDGHCSGEIVRRRYPECQMIGEWTGVGQAVLIDANGTPYQVEVIE